MLIPPDRPLTPSTCRGDSGEPTAAPAPAPNPHCEDAASSWRSPARSCSSRLAVDSARRATSRNLCFSKSCSLIQLADTSASPRGASASGGLHAGSSPAHASAEFGRPSTPGARPSADDVAPPPPRSSSEDSLASTSYTKSCTNTAARTAWETCEPSSSTRRSSRSRQAVVPSASNFSKPRRRGERWASLSWSPWRPIAFSAPPPRVAAPCSGGGCGPGPKRRAGGEWRRA
mmetsp:Transcript_15893/g.43925  ORF Transcript_15893/g.43925 Transcript_15893/m.43925 type:complete len:231 (+) Transcript_15893:171-863(+)